jgi:16S rRNA (guanine966-N2)-methyltransferase
MDRVRESVFNMLASWIDIEGASVCDLFAGAGSYGIEAVSRGAANVTFVEMNPRTVAQLESNISTLGISGCCTVQRADVVQFARRLHGSFDLVFADPPYDFNGSEQVLRLLVENGILRDGGVLVWEYTTANPPAAHGALDPVRERTIGTTGIAIYINKGGRMSP